MDSGFLQRPLCLECQVEPVLALRSWASFSDFIPIVVAREVKFLQLDSASDKLAESILRAGAELSPGVRCITPAF